MCGRFTLRAPASVVAEQFAVFEVEPFTPRFNVAPTQPVAIVRARKDDPADARELTWIRWGLIPSWAKEVSIGNRLINARLESIAQKPAFRSAFQQRRCLIVADGFFEWQRTAGRKQPYYIGMRDQRPFAFAGLWESWRDPAGAAEDTPIESCAILTGPPNALVAPIHDRMPVILDRGDYAAWLDPTAQNPQGFSFLGRPYPREPMIAYPVGAYVNSPAHDDPRCVEPE
jgi:putative SOS response-associated peptidase YedK